MPYKIGLAPLLVANLYFLAACNGELGQIGNNALETIGAKPVGAASSQSGIQQVEAPATSPYFGEGNGVATRSQILKLSSLDFSQGQSTKAIRSVLPGQPILYRDGIEYYRVERNPGQLIGVRFDAATGRYIGLEFAVDRKVPQ